ncbi:unnamed protein product [Heligmosomoides polygyrus]|uniref:Peptidase_S9_N domain-containing protein n=1 Tax=Heligmosomoides polygyrus TaxID=6339 RepID=A0A183FZ31_HELPZ|nr:unnamed protein product [Heligmosomoides polygyrus]
MEDPDSSETREFVDELNSISEPFIAQAPCREKIRQRLTEIWNYEKYTCPSKHGNFYYYCYNSGLQNQFVVYQQKSLIDKGEVFLDPNALSSDGTISIRYVGETEFMKTANSWCHYLRMVLSEHYIISKEQCK